MKQIRVPTLPGAKASRRPAGASSRERLENRFYGGKQMTAYVEHPETDRPRSSAGAPPAKMESQTDRPVMAIETARRHANRLQLRIAKVMKQDRDNKVGALQRLTILQDAAWRRKVLNRIDNELNHRVQWPLRGLSRMRGNPHVRFLEGWESVTAPGYSAFHERENHE